MTGGAPPGICLIGCGWWGAIHALALKRQGRRIRRYYASRTIEDARDFAQRFDGQAFKTADDALADPAVDAVVIALPHDLQTGMAERALRAGKHVLIEKPIAVDLPSAERVVRAAKESGRCLAVAEEYRLSPLVQAAHTLIRQGVIGKVVWVQVAAAGAHRPLQKWKNQRGSMGGGVLIDVGVHYVDILRFWLGEPELVWATYPPHLNEQFEGEDSVVALLRFEGGVAATIALSWSSHRSRSAPHIEVSGEHGSLELRFDRPFLIHHSPLPSQHWSHRLKRSLPWRVTSRISPLMPREVKHRLRVRNHDLIGSEALIEDFIEAITVGRQPAVSGVEGLEDLRVVLAAYQAAETGTPIALDRAFRTLR